MDTLACLQTYWWFLISLLGALLVFLLFVQGGQSLLANRLTSEEKQLMVNSLGRKWEFTYTTLVVFGGAFFASFPLFYSTSFGGAYWLWMLILVSFVVQAFSYEFRRKKGNIYGRHAYDGLLMFNGLFGCVCLGVAVGTLFFGAPFTVSKLNILNPWAPVISQWSSTHGLEAFADYRNLLFGFMVFFLARTLGALYFLNDIAGEPALDKRMRRQVLVNGICFVLCFLPTVYFVLTAAGLRADAAGVFQPENYIFWNNLLSLPWLLVAFLAGVIAVLYAIIRASADSKWRAGIWYAGIGTVVVVLGLFTILGYNSTAYLQSTISPQSSLSIANSSSTLFTLKVMSWVSVLIPFVLAYIWFVWRKMNAKPITEAELQKESHVY